MRYQQLLAGMHDKPATLAIVPSLLALAMMHSLMAAPDLSSLRQFMLDTRSFFIESPSADDNGNISQHVAAADQADSGTQSNAQENAQEIARLATEIAAEQAASVQKPADNSPAEMPAADAPAVAQEDAFRGYWDLQKLAEANGKTDDLYTLRYRVIPMIVLPVSMKIDQQKKVVIKLAVDDTGQIRQLDIEQSSGLPALDKLIRKAYANAAFYPYRPYSFDHAFISRYVLTVQAQPGDASAQPQRVIPRVSTDIVQDEAEAQRIFSKQFTMGERTLPYRKKPDFSTIQLKSSQVIEARFRLAVNRYGNVIGVQVLDSSGDPALDAQLADIYRRVAFKPFEVSGMGISTAVMQSFRYDPKVAGR